MPNVIICGDQAIEVDAEVKTWFDHGKRFTAKAGGVRPRKGRPNINLLHWTGSENEPLKVFANLLKRKSAGAPYGLSCHSVLAYDGVLWQFADFEFDVTLHGGEVNGRANGFEIQNKAFPPAAAAFPRGVQRQFLKGADRSILTFTTPQLETIEAVLFALNQRYKIPDRVPTYDIGGEDHVYPYALTPAQLEKFKGTCCHFHVSRRSQVNKKWVTRKDKQGRIISGKLDAGLQILESLLEEDGYQRWPV